MVIRDYKGIYNIENRGYTEKDFERFDAKYGAGNWKLTEPICSNLSPDCSYGLPRTSKNCRFCNGKCLRPLDNKTYNYNHY